MAKEAVVVFGPTQAGKSTFVDYVTESQNPIPTGDGDGESVTTMAKLYFAIMLCLPILDTPGINDSRLLFSNNEAAKRVALAVAQAGITRLVFLVFDSLANDSMQLRNTLAELITHFGSEVLPAVIVLATKADSRTEQQNERRLQKMREVAQQQGIRAVMPWQNVGLTEEGMTAQLLQLKAKIEQTTGVSTRELVTLHARVDRRAQELYDKQIPGTQKVNVQEEYQEAFTEQEPYTEEYVDCVRKTEEYTEHVPYTTTVKRTVEHQTIERKPLIGKIFTLGIMQDELRTRTSSVDVPVTEFKEVTRQRVVWVPERKTRQAFRTVTKYRTKTRQVEKDTEFLIPMEEFKPKAAAEIMDEERSKLAAASGGGDSEWSMPLGASAASDAGH